MAWTRTDLCIREFAPIVLTVTTPLMIACALMDAKLTFILFSWIAYFK